MRVLIFLLLPLFFSTGPKPREIALRSAIKCVEVPEGYKYCDSDEEGDGSCFFRYNGKLYLKKNKAFFDKEGNLEKAYVYTPVGVRAYNMKELQADEKFVKHNDWKLHDNAIIMEENKVLRPVTGLAEVDNFMNLVLVPGQKFSYLYECRGRINGRPNIEVISAYKRYDSASQWFLRSKDSCEKWLLTNSQIEDIIGSSSQIDGHEWHYYYDVYPCYYEGKVNIDGREAGYRINAGAFMNIRFKDTTILLGYQLKDSNKYFIPGRAAYD